MYKPDRKILASRSPHVVFRLNALPLLLNTTLRYHVSKNKDEDPQFAREMLEGFYVDDQVTGKKNSNATFHLHEKSKQRMAAAGFRL